MSAPRSFFKRRSLLSAMMLEILLSLLIIIAVSFIALPRIQRYISDQYIKDTLLNTASLFDREELPKQDNSTFVFFRVSGGKTRILNSNYDDRYADNDIIHIVEDFEQQLADGEVQTGVVRSLSSQSFAGGHIYYVFTRTKTNFYNVIVTDKARISFPYKSELIVLYISGIVFASFVISIILFIYLDRISKSLTDINNYLLDRTEPNEQKAFSAEILTLYSNFYMFRDSLAKAEKEKQELFQNISHELKTPITTIKLYADAIMDDVCIQGKGHSEMAQIISTEADNLLYKVRKIMILNKLSYHETNKPQIHQNEKVNISDVLFEVMNLYNQRAPEINFVANLDSLEYRGPNEIWRTVLENIFDNNIRHGAKNIYISCSEKYLTIENDGELIEAQILDKIFEPFNRGKKGNFGLGMGIIKQSLELYGYSVKVYNNYELNRVCYSIIDNN